MDTETQNDLIGFTVVPSTANNIRIITAGNTARLPIVGKSIFVVLDLEDAQYLALGMVTNITTNNQQVDTRMQQVVSRTFDENSRTDKGTNFRVADVKLQSTFRKAEGEKSWSQYGASLPTSPDAYTPVRVLTETQIFDLIDREEFAFLGRNHQTDVLAPFSPVSFSDASGAVHSAFFAKSGSGKSVFCSINIAANMRDVHRAVILIDPQGQWATENGLLFSPQAFAQSLGREVSILKVSEDIRLNPDQDLIEKMLGHSGMWKRFMKMGGEIQGLLSGELAEYLIYHRHSFEKEPREVLEGFFIELEDNESQLKKIYASESRRLDLQNRLRELLHMETVDEDGNTQSQSEVGYEKASKDMGEIVDSFAPVHNLFTDHNIYGRKRKSLTGAYGTLEKVLSPRTASDGPAPYVILDMSSNKSAQALAEFAKDAGVDNSALKMSRLLGNNDVKTVILKYIFSEMTSIAEDSFSEGEGNLNTEIVFDEAMRFAMPPQQASSDDAKEFTNDLAEYARDTRKFGIGWTYILQTPTGLNVDIFKQLTNIFIGWGLSGKDLQMIGEQMDGREYLDIYSSFAPPRSTQRYPFMLLGTMSPLIFTHTPSFVDSFTDMEDFLNYNSQWINELGTRYGRGTVSFADISHEAGQRLRSEDRKARKIDKKPSSQPKKPLRVGSNAEVEENAPVRDKSADWQVQGDEEPPF